MKKSSLAARALKSVSHVWSTVDKWIFSRWPSLAQASGFGGEPSYTGKNVDEIASLNCSTVYACSRVISDPVGMLPLDLFERLEDDERKKATGDPLYKLLRNAPNKFTTAINFRQTLQLFALLWGNGYARIIRRAGREEVLSFRIIHPSRVTPKIGDEGDPVYEVTQGTEKPITLQFREMLHIPGLGFDGIQGQSVIRMAANTIGLDLAALEYGGSFFSRGGRIPYILKIAKRFANDQEKEKFRSDWEKTYADPHRMVLVDGGGVEYEQIGINPEDAQMLGTRLFSVPEICRWFLVNPYKVGDGRHATMNNVEQLGIEFLQTTIGYWLEVWVQQIWLRVLSEKQQERMYAEFNVDKLLQGDFASRMEGYSKAKANGWMNADTICKKENLPRLPNQAGAAYHMQGAMVVVPGTGEPTAYERAKLALAEASANRSKGAPTNGA